MQVCVYSMLLCMRGCIKSWDLIVFLILQLCDLLQGIQMHRHVSGFGNACMVRTLNII